MPSIRSDYFLFLVYLLLMACRASHSPVPSRFPRFDLEGHRGCRGLMPENTIPAMIKALDLGVTTLEMDAYITHDGQVIISHDPYFNHEITTLPDGSYLDEKHEKNLILFRMDYAQTQQYDVGLKPYPRFPRQKKMAVQKPLLQDLIDSVELYCQQHRRALPFYNIETKSLPVTDQIYHPVPEVFTDTLMNLLVRKGMLARVIIQSFDPRTIRIVHRKYPHVITSLLVAEPDKRSLTGQLADLGFIPDIYSPDFSRLNDSLVKECHQYHMKVIPWTVNTPEEIRRLMKMGIDGIISDFPDLFHE